MSWVNGENGPTCKCGWPTLVSIKEGELPILWCFGHTKAEGAYWCLPQDKPANWPDLNDEEMQALVTKGEAEHNQKEEIESNE